jgi:hypothetical protein
MTRLTKTLALGAATVLVAGAATAPSATADPAQPGGVAYSAAFDYTPGGVSASASITGLVGVLVGPLVNPILAAVTSTVVPVINTLSTSLENALVSLVTATGTKATTPPYQVTNPAPGWPTCSAPGWSAQTCYKLTNVGVPAAPLINLSIPTVRGYTDADPSVANGQPFIGRAEVAHPQLDLLGASIGDLGDINSLSTCPTSGSTPAAPSPASSLVGLSLLGGLITATVSDSHSGLAAVSVGGTPLVGIQSITTPDGLPATVSLDGGLLTITLSLDLSALLGGLGLGAIAGLTGLAGSNLALTLHIGPGNTAGTTTAQTWGLEVKANLSGTVNLSLLGLVGASLVVGPSVGAASDADLLDLKFASTNCTTGQSAAPNIWIPPGLI